VLTGAWLQGTAALRPGKPRPSVEFLQEKRDGYEVVLAVRTPVTDETFEAAERKLGSAVFMRLFAYDEDARVGEDRQAVLYTYTVGEGWRLSH
jgi:hypothetical protein